MMNTEEKEKIEIKTIKNPSYMTILTDRIEKDEVERNSVVSDKFQSIKIDLKENENKDELVIDWFFNTLGYGKYQWKVFFILSFVFFSESINLILVPMIIKILEKEFNMIPSQKSTLMSSGALGNALGSLFASINMDTYGRKKFILIGGWISFLFAFLTYFSNSYEFFSICRLMVGLGIGIQMPSAVSLLSECIPKYNRSYFLSAVWISYLVGEIYFVLFAWNIIPTMVEGNWKLLVSTACVPILLSTLICITIEESARYYYSNKFYTQGKYVLEFIENCNRTNWWGKEESPLILENSNLNKSKILSEKHFKQIEYESEKQEFNKLDSKLSDIFEGIYLNITLKTWVLWICASCSIFLVYIMSPLILIEIEINENKGKVAKNNNSYFLGIILGALLSSPKIIISPFLCDKLGRIKALQILFGLQLIFMLFCSTTTTFIYFNLGILKLLSESVTVSIKLYTLEIYPTKLRGLGSAGGATFARFFQILVPFICQLMIYIGGTQSSSFYLGVIFSIVGIVISFYLKTETNGKNLDDIS